MAIGAPILGYISDHIKRRKSVMIFCATLGIITTLGITFWSGSSEPIFIMLFFGLGISAAGIAIGFAAISEHVPANLHATAIGFNNTFQVLSSGFAISLIGFMIQFSMHGHVRISDTFQTSDFTLGLSSLVLINIIGLLIAVFAIKESFCHQQHEPFKLKINPFI